VSSASRNEDKTSVGARSRRRDDALVAQLLHARSLGRIRILREEADGLAEHAGAIATRGERFDPQYARLGQELASWKDGEITAEKGERFVWPAGVERTPRHVEGGHFGGQGPGLALRGRRAGP
jgi:hypothetical protein